MKSMPFVGPKKHIGERRSQMPRIVYSPGLPILDKRNEIVSAVRRHPVVVVTGETGSGKTTQIPKMCLEAGRGLAGRIGCTQPRRIAATTVARRLAEELGEEIGRSVGYKIRFDDQTPPKAIFKIMTDGILLMEAQQDALLQSYDTIIVDEAHERSLNIDFILGILIKVLEKRRDLRVVITSATIDTEKFSLAFGNAPIIEVSGRVYPVEVRYEPRGQDNEEDGDITHIDAAVQAVEDLTSGRRAGDILIFMPTERDIRETCELLNLRLKDKAAILPLFSRLSRFQQERVFHSMPLRKIVVATNIAETSLTIPGIRYVVDTGLARISQYNPRSRTMGLPVKAISRSSADQRKGRCGRVQNGTCIRLYTEEEYLSRPLYTAPEILRSNLAGVLLRMLSLGLGNISDFPFIDRPLPKNVRDGIDTLRELQAIEREPDDTRRKISPWILTERGRMMARLPIDPRIARMILEAKKKGCLAEILVIAAALSVQDPRERPAGKEAEADRLQALFQDPASDFVSLLNIWKRCSKNETSARSQNRIRRFCREHFLSWRRIREWRDVHEQLRTILSEHKFLPAKSVEIQKEGGDLYAAIHRSILSGYLGHIALKNEKNLYSAAHGRQAMIFPGSGLFNRAGKWIVAAEMIETSRLFARTAANIDSAWLEELGGDLCRRSYSGPHWEKNRGEVVAFEQVTLFGLVIVSGRTVSFSRIDPEEAGRIFIRSALVDGEIRHPPPFLIHNQALIAKVVGMEEKLRRHDLLVDEQRILEFYEQRLPGIFDARTLQRLVRDRGSDSFLRMKESDLLARSPDATEIELYPDAVSADGCRFRCVYRFDPGSLEDGVTLKIPRHTTRSVSAASLDWSVPGLLREKIAALLRGLPKEFRKKLFPLARTADAIWREMPRKGTLINAIGRFIYERYGVSVPADRWPMEHLDPHLKLRYSIVDDKNRELAAGRDMVALQKNLADEGEADALANAKMIWEKTGLKAWNFGDLPETVPLLDGRVQQGVAYPALMENDEGVCLRLFPDPRTSRMSHRMGVKALLKLELQSELRHLRKGLAPTGELRVWAASFGGAKALENALFEKVLHDHLEADIRIAEDFREYSIKIRSLIHPRGQQVMKAAEPVIKALYEVTESFRIIEIANRDNRPFLAYLGDLRKELSTLLPADFLIRYESDRLSHICRYLRAMSIRAEKGSVHLEKALAREAEVRDLVERFKGVSQLTDHSSDEKRLALEEFFWWIEEYKVSLFAQELKTSVPISRKRLDARLAEIERML